MLLEAGAGGCLEVCGEFDLQVDEKNGDDDEEKYKGFGKLLTKDFHVV